MRRVLLILRDDGSRSIMRRLLKERYELVICEHPDEGEKELSQHFDALIMDMFFPGALGFSFLMHNAERLPGVIITISEWWTDEALAFCRKMGVKAVSLSPFSPSAVADRLDDYFPNHRPYLTPLW